MVLVLRLGAWQVGIRLLETVHSIAYLVLWSPENQKFFSKPDPKSPKQQCALIYSYHWQEKKVLRRVVSTSYISSDTSETFSFGQCWRFTGKNMTQNIQRVFITFLMSLVFFSLIHFWVIVKMSTGKVVSISTQSQEGRYPLRSRKIVGRGKSGMSILLYPHVTTFPSRWGASAASAAEAGSSKFLALFPSLFFMFPYYINRKSRS